jgi:hypothetical protein
VVKAKSNIDQNRLIVGIQVDKFQIGHKGLEILLFFKVTVSQILNTKNISGVNLKNLFENIDSTVDIIKSFVDVSNVIHGVDVAGHILKTSFINLKCLLKKI